MTYNFGQYRLIISGELWMSNSLTIILYSSFKPIILRTWANVLSQLLGKFDFFFSPAVRNWNFRLPQTVQFISSNG